MPQLLFRSAAQRHILLVLPFLIWVICGCAAVRPQSRAIPPINDPKQFLRSMLHDYDELKYFSSLCRMKITSPRGSVSVKGAVVGILPSCLRVEMFAFLNQLAFILASDGSGISVYLPTRNAFYKGKADDDHVSFLYGADIRLQEAISLFLGYPRIALSDTAPVTWQDDNGRYVFRIPAESNRLLQIWVDYGLNRITRYRLSDAAGTALYEYSFSDFRPAGVHRVPYAIDLYFHSSQTRIRVTYSEIDTSLQPDPALFALAPPPRAERLPLEELSRYMLLQPE